MIILIRSVLRGWIFWCKFDSNCIKNNRVLGYCNFRGETQLVFKPRHDYTHLKRLHSLNPNILFILPNVSTPGKCGPWEVFPSNGCGRTWDLLVIRFSKSATKWLFASTTGVTTESLSNFVFEFVILLNKENTGNFFLGQFLTATQPRRISRSLLFLNKFSFMCLKTKENKKFPQHFYCFTHFFATNGQVDSVSLKIPKKCLKKEQNNLHIT